MQAHAHVDTVTSHLQSCCNAPSPAHARAGMKSTDAINTCMCSDGTLSATVSPPRTSKGLEYAGLLQKPAGLPGGTQLPGGHEPRCQRLRMLCVAWLLVSMPACTSNTPPCIPL